MAMTNFGTNDPLAVKLWSKSLDVEAAELQEEQLAIHQQATAAAAARGKWHLR